MFPFKHFRVGSEGYEGLGAVSGGRSVLGGHLDTTFRGWSATLAARVRSVLARLVLIFALPSDFSW